MIRQGYVPAGCTLDDQLAGPLIYSEVNAGRDPCAGCAADRAKCGGRPPKCPEFVCGVSDILNRRDQQKLIDQADERRRVAENPVFEFDDVIGEDEPGKGHRSVLNVRRFNPK